MSSPLQGQPGRVLRLQYLARISTYGRRLLDQIIALLQAYGYAVAGSQHDFGRIGRLAQSRKRFHLVARFIAKVLNFLYEPARHPLPAVGEMLGRMPPPGDLAGGIMHRTPSLQ